MKVLTAKLKKQFNVGKSFKEKGAVVEEFDLDLIDKPVYMLSQQKQASTLQDLMVGNTLSHT